MDKKKNEQVAIMQEHGPATIAVDHPVFGKIERKVKFFRVLEPGDKIQWEFDDESR